LVGSIRIGMAEKTTQRSFFKSPKFTRRRRAASGYGWNDVGPSEKGTRKTLFGICSQCMQHDCATLVHMEDGLVVGVEGNPASPPNYGSLCPRGNAQIMGLYNPHRVKTPLVRTNPEKGLDVDPMWKEVTWDEALDLVAEKLRAVREKDPRGLLVCEGFSDRETILRNPFAAAFGTPNLVGSHGPLCTIHYASNLVHAAMPEAIAEMERCEYLLSLGRSVGPNFATTGATRRFARAMARGMELVVVDPRCSTEASKGEWIPIRPGSDLAFLLAMAHVMMHEGLQMDEWFLKNRTNAPYLIGHDENYYRDPTSGKPMMWDPSERSAKVFDASFADIALYGTYDMGGVPCRTGLDLIRGEYAKYTPEWAEQICTVPATTIRRIARDFVGHAKVGSTIRIDDFAFPFRPASINTHRGVNNHRGGTYADLVGKIINMMVGNIEVPGGCVGDSQRGPLLFPDADGIVTPQYEAKPHPFTFPPDCIDLHEFYPNRHTSPALAAKAILDPEKYHINYDIDVWINVGANLIRKNAQPDFFVKTLKKIPFVVSFGYHFDEPTIMADVVLPVHSSMERSSCVVFLPPHQATGGEIAGMNMAYMRQPVPPVFNTRHADDIFTDLAERVGILCGEGGLYDRLNKSKDKILHDDGFSLEGTGQELELDRKHALEEIYDRQLKSWRHGDGRGIEELKKVGFFKHTAPRKNWYTYSFFPDNKTRHPFYFEHLLKTGDTLRANLRRHNIRFPGVRDEERIFERYHAIPTWIENSEIQAPPEYDLWVINWKTPYYAHDPDNVGGNPWLAELRQNDPFDGDVIVSTATACRKELKEGDVVAVGSRYGKTRGVLRVTRADTSRRGGHTGESRIGYNPIKPSEPGRDQHQSPASPG
jgi:anaerobic selenocysteine-containing dehydrogenase